MNALLSFWLRLTGGEQACPRGRFALTMLAACGCYHLLFPHFVHCFTTLSQHGLPEEFAHPCTFLALAGLAVAMVSLLLVAVPLSPLALLGVEVSLYEAFRLLQGASPTPTPAPDALWPYWAGFLLGSLALLLAGSIALGCAWRRLKDAGRSPLFMLLGLTCLLGFDDKGSFSAESAGLYLLGPLWLIILYIQPSRRHGRFTIFRPLR